MVDPTPEDLEKITNVSELFAWAAVTAELSAKFFSIVGEVGHIRELVLIPDKEFNDVLDKLEHGLNLMQKTRLRYARRVARLKCGLNPENSDGAVGAPPGGSDATSHTAPAGSSGRKVKVSTVLDQTCDAEIQSLDPATVRKMFEDYAAGRGDVPHPDVEPTADQLSAFKQVIADDGVPYTDFAVFGPRGARLQKKFTFLSFVHQPNGEWRKVELPGPPDFNTWWRCFRILKTLLLLLGVVQVEHIDNYGEFIRGLHDTYGSRVWFIIYQADVRMRQEELESTRRHAEASQNKYSGTPLATLSSLDPKKPWDTVFKLAVSGHCKSFWDREVRDNVFMYLSDMKPLAAVTDDGTAQNAWARGNPPPPPNPPGCGATRGRQRSKTPPRNRPTKRAREADDKSRRNSEGYFTHNRKGIEVCFNWNKGDCPQPCPSKRTHQCSGCLRNDHRGNQCPQNPSAGGAGPKLEGGKGGKTGGRN